MSVLAAAVSRTMTASTRDLAVLDRGTGQWSRHPFQEVHARAENIAERVGDGPDGAVGLVGEPTVELIAAIQGAWLAGRALSILPGPIRGADEPQWARSTAQRFADIGVTQVFSHGSLLNLLCSNSSGLAVHDVASVGHAQRSTTFAQQSAPGGTPAVLQGTAGSTGTPRTAVLSPEAVLNNVTGLLSHAGVDPAVDVGCTWLPLYHDMGLTFLLNALISDGEIWVAPTASFAASPFRWLTWLVREPGNPHRGTQFRVLGAGQVRPAGARRRPQQDAVRHQRRRAHRLRGLRPVLHRTGALRPRSPGRRPVLRSGRINLRGGIPATRQRAARRRDRRPGNRFGTPARRPRPADSRHGVANSADRALGGGRPRDWRDRDPRDVDDVGLSGPGDARIRRMVHAPGTSDT